MTLKREEFGGLIMAKFILFCLILVEISIFKVDQKSIEQFCEAVFGSILQAVRNLNERSKRLEIYITYTPITQLTMI